MRKVQPRQPQIGDRVINSPHGAGEIGSFNQLGWPELLDVRGFRVALAWLTFEDGTVWDPVQICTEEDIFSIVEKLSKRKRKPREPKHEASR